MRSLPSRLFPPPPTPASVLCEIKRRQEENQNLRNCQPRSPEDARTRCQRGGAPGAACPRADGPGGRGGLLLRGPGLWRPRMEPQGHDQWLWQELLSCEQRDKPDSSHGRVRGRWSRGKRLWPREVGPGRGGRNGAAEPRGRVCAITSVTALSPKTWGSGRGDGKEQRTQSADKERSWERRGLKFQVERDPPAQVTEVFTEQGGQGTGGSSAGCGGLGKQTPPWAWGCLQVTEWPPAANHWHTVNRASNHSQWALPCLCSHLLPIQVSPSSCQWWSLTTPGLVPPRSNRFLLE